MKLRSSIIQYKYGSWYREGNRMYVVARYPFVPKGYKPDYTKTVNFHFDQYAGLHFFDFVVEGWSSGVVIHPDKYYKVIGIQFGFANSITVKAKAEEKAKHIAIQDFQFSIVTDVKELCNV